MVAVECKGQVTTKWGQRYDNHYCFVFEFVTDGKLLVLTKYLDTALAERVLERLSPAAWIEALTLGAGAEESQPMVSCGLRICDKKYPPFPPSESKWACSKPDHLSASCAGRIRSYDPQVVSALFQRNRN